jgi:glutamate 5-kinase
VKKMRVVIKIGSSTLAHSTGKLNIRLVENLCKVISDIKNAGHEIIMVSSGAIAMGVSKLALGKKPADMPTKQAAAAVGQCELMYTYDKLFSEYHHTVAQILITKEDVENQHRQKHFKDTMTRLIELSALPIINENDTVATAEIAVGDNDTLAAIVATTMQADLLILLSDIDGLYSADPRLDSGAKLISEVSEINDSIIALAGGAGTSLGTGGMATKIHAAQICTASGVDMVIANGTNPQILYDIIQGKSVGTRFIADKK